MPILHCVYDYENTDSVIASWILKRKFNGVDFLPHTKDESIPYIWARDPEQNVLIFIGTDHFPFLHMKKYNIKTKKFYIFNNNETYINNYNNFKDLLYVELREIMDINQSLSKLVWEYIFPDVKIPIFVQLINEYFVENKNKEFGTYFENRITYIQDMNENIIRKKDFSDIFIK